MNTEYRYQLESKKLTGHQPRKLTCLLPLHPGIRVGSSVKVV